MHFIGIGGIGMSGLARILLKRKMSVTGSDLNPSYVTEGLEKEGAKVFIGHSAGYIQPNMTVVYNSDIKLDNPEYQAALRLQCKVLHRSDLLAQLMQGYKVLAVTGTHGKTTTTSLLTMVLSHLDPCFAVGGIVHQKKANAGHGSGEYFVAEADESDGTFLKYSPYAAIITNIDIEHMKHFGTEENLIHSFEKFASQVQSTKHLFWCGDDVRLRALRLKGFSYGTGDQCDLKVSQVKQTGWGSSFTIQFQGKVYQDIQVALSGAHNALNASAVFGLALTLGVSETHIRDMLLNFKGVKRRCEKKGEVNQILVLDDYGHHPTEIKTTLEGIRKAVGERRIIAVYQPHRYSRTQECRGTFGGIFDAADQVLITDIFAASEAPLPGITHQLILDELAQDTVTKRYVPRQLLLQEVMQMAMPHDVIVTFGAGDITNLGKELVERLEKSEPKKIKVGVIFGGQSTEHEISILSAQHFIEGLQKGNYHITYFGITKEGRWVSGEAAELVLQGKYSAAPAQTMIDENTLRSLQECDILLPVLHGTYGEDGTIQGFFEMLNKPYVGCDHRSAAICMDKALTKALVMNQGVPSAKYIAFSRQAWLDRSHDLLKQIVEELTFPVFVKPTHLGSSVGVKKVESHEGLSEAIRAAFKYDTHILVENGIKAREIEFSVYGNNRPATFPPGEICTGGQVYDYEAKYGANCFKTETEAVISIEKKEEGMRLAKLAYEAVGCTGYARVDFFFDQQERFWFNEINPIPGFTPISLFPKICRQHGMNIDHLVDQLIILGFERHRAKERTNKSI